MSSCLSLGFWTVAAVLALVWLGNNIFADSAMGLVGIMMLMIVGIPIALAAWLIRKIFF